MATAGTPFPPDEGVAAGRGTGPELEVFRGVVIDVLRQGTRQYLDDVVREIISPQIKCRQIDVAHAAVEDTDKALVLEQNLGSPLERVRHVISLWTQPVLQGTTTGAGVSGSSNWSAPAGQAAVASARQERSSPSQPRNWFRFRWLWPTPSEATAKKARGQMVQCSAAEKQVICEGLSALALLDACLMNTNIAVNRLLVRHNVESVSMVALSPVCSGDRNRTLQNTSSAASWNAPVVPFEHQVYIIRARQYLMRWASVMLPLVADFPEFQQAAASIENDGLVLVLRLPPGRRRAALRGNASAPRPGLSSRPTTTPTASAGATRTEQPYVTGRFYRATTYPSYPWSWILSPYAYSGVCYHYRSGPPSYVVTNSTPSQPNPREQMLQRLRAEFRETRETVELLLATNASFREESANELPEPAALEHARRLYGRVRLMHDGLARLVPRVVEPPLREEAARLLSDAQRALNEFAALCESDTVLGAALRPDDEPTDAVPQHRATEHVRGQSVSDDTRAAAASELSSNETNVAPMQSPSAPSAEELVAPTTTAAPVTIGASDSNHQVTSAYLIDADEDEVSHDTVQHPVLQPQRSHRLGNQASPGVEHSSSPMKFP
jgi:hypothetical protein